MGTELFKVSCVTCGASLSVRNPALVDQIVACPKCDSMVHVVPPTIAAPTAAVAPPAEAPLLDAASTFDELPVRFADNIETASDAAVPTETASVLDVAGVSNANFFMLAIGSFVVGVTLMGTFLLLRNRGDAATATPQQATTEVQPIDAAEPIASSVSEDESKSAVSAPAAVVAVDDPLNAPVSPSARSSLKVTSEPAEPSLLGPIEQIAEDSVPGDSPLAPAQERPAQKLVVDSPNQPRIARKFDPLGIDPEELNLADMSEAGADEGTVAEGPAEPKSPDDVRPVNSVVPVRLDEESGRGTPNRIASIQLRKEIPAIAVRNMPLLDFVVFVGQLAGVPVSVGPEQLQMAGTTPGKPVSVEMAAATLGEVLQEVLGPLRLEAIADGPQVTIVRQEAEKRRTVDYPIDDLLGDSFAAADFGSWIETLIAPESWKSSGGDGTLVASRGALTIEQTQAVQYQVLFFLERIRLAKGLPLRSKYPARLLSGKPYGLGVADRLSAPATFTFSHDTALAEVFRYWQGEAGLPIFVDWPALARVGLWPDSRITCTSANESWHSALDKILSPLDLAWRAVAGGAIQITSRARVETEPVVDIYPSGTWHGGATEAVVIEDPVNNLTYVRAPASAHRQ